MNKKQRGILDFIKVIRCSFADAKIVYRFGGCYGFYQIMKHIYPESVAYIVDGQHILIAIGDDIYDIKGFHYPDSDEVMKEMTEEDHYMAESWKDGQRLEYMLKKYSDSNKLAK